MAQIKTTVRGVNGQGTGCAKSVQFDCQGATISDGWLNRSIRNGTYYEEVSLKQAESGTNSDAGVIVTMENGQNYFIAGTTVALVQAGCNACCGAVTPIAEVAPAAFVNPAATTAFCLTTTGDDGSSHFRNKLELKLYGSYDVTKGISRFATNKFTFYSSDALADIIVPTGWTVASGACA